MATRPVTNDNPMIPFNTTVETLSTAAARRRYVADIEAAVERVPGAKLTLRTWRMKDGVTPSPKSGSAQCRLEFAVPGKLSVMLYIEKGVPLLHWYGAESRLRYLPEAWLTVNPFHGCKATSHPCNFNALINSLVAGLTAAADGTAFI